jgi:hypothetical protein
MANRSTVVTTVLFSAVVWAVPAYPQAVSVHDGNVVLVDAAGKQRQLTSVGRDGEPDLSPDKQWVVFVRRVSGPKISGPMGDDVDPNEIWIIGADGQQARRLVRSEGCEPHGGCPLSGLTRPQFADDGNGIFFEAKCAVVTSCIYHLDLRTKVRKDIGGGSFLHVIHDGSLRGNLLVIKHKYFMCGGSYDWWWVVKPDGSEVGALGQVNEGSEDEARSALSFCVF